VQSRMKMLMGATALLYIGPLMGGLGGYGWAIVPVFLALFLLWLYILRPQLWPRNFHEWTQYQAWVTFGTTAATQLLLVAMLFGVGRGIGGTLGITLPLGPMLPISISFLAIPLARLFWDASKHTDIHDVIDIGHPHAQQPIPATTDPALTTARAMIAPLSDLPDDTPPQVIAQHLTALIPHTQSPALRAALLERHRAFTASRAETLALILHSTDADLINDIPNDGPTIALQLLPDDPELIALFASRLADALAQDPEIWGKCPSTDLLSALVRKYDNTQAEAPLRDLIEATDAAAPEDGLA
jgi:hypothetical protein